MKKLILAFILANTALQAQTVFQKAISFPFSIPPSSQINSIRPTSDGGYIFLSGYNNGLTKVDASGAIAWSKKFVMDSIYGTNSYCAGECNGGGYYLLGGEYDYNYNTNMFFVRTDVSGNVLWKKEFLADDAMEGMPSVFQATNGDFLISTIGMQMGLTRMSSSGTIIYQQRYGLDSTNASKTPAIGAAMGTDGGVLICSSLTGLGLVKTDASGNIQWKKDYYDPSTIYYPAAIISTDDGGYLISGSEYNVNNTFFLMKIDANGTITWLKLYSSLQYPQVNALTQAPNGNIQLAGTNYMTGQGFAAQFDASGNFLSGGIISNNNNQYFGSITIHSCSDNGMIIETLCQDIVTSMQATTIFKTDASGNLGCGYQPMAITDVTGSTVAPVDAQTIIYQTNVTGTVNQHAVNDITVATLETDFCLLFSVNEQADHSISLSAFPSPVSSGENLHLNVSGIKEASLISIYDANGKVVQQYNMELVTDQTSTIEIPTSGMRAGIYLVRITGNNQEVVGSAKFVVK